MASSRHSDSVRNETNRVNLTNPRINQLPLQPQGKQSFLWDSNTSQLGVRATSGTKAFIFQSRLKNGDSIRLTIGKCADRTIEDARIRARELQRLIDDGLDPREVIADKIKSQEAARQHREAIRQVEINNKLTCGEVWEVYVKTRSIMDDERKPWGERTILDHKVMVSPGGVKRKRAAGNTESGILYPLMKMRLSDITQEVIEALMRKENKQRATRAALAFRLFRGFIRWAYDQPEYRDIVNLECVAPSISKKAVRKPKLKLNDCLQREDLKPWFKAIRDLNNPVQSAYLQALLITGARKNEMMGVEWSHLDFKRKSIVINDKVDGERVIPLTPYLSSILNSLPKVNKWVFSANSKTGCLHEPRAAHVRALEMAGLPHISIHGLRRSFGTLAEWVEAPVGVVAQIQGHKPSAIAEKHYRRRPIDLLRAWHVKIEAWMLEEAGIEIPQENLPSIKMVVNNAA